MRKNVTCNVARFVIDCAFAIRAKMVPVTAATEAPEMPDFVRLRSWRMMVISCRGKRTVSMQ